MPCPQKRKRTLPPISCYVVSFAMSKRLPEMKSRSTRHCGFGCSLFLLITLLVLAPVAALAQEPAKSPNDEREYRALVLDNGMQVLLISDAETDMAAASMDIRVGSKHDPRAFPGLTHFLEHMLFLGTAPYPEAGEFQEFISTHGGGNNAYTAYENTNYYFDIESGHLAPALDRFAQFFIAPLFTPAYVDRERNAVDSEYRAGLQDDGRRGLAAFKAVLNPAHPLAMFSTGSIDTLQDQPGKSLRDALLQHYERYYSADRMALAVLGRQSLDELEALVRAAFSAVALRDAGEEPAPVSLFEADSLPAMLAVKPVRDLRSLSFTFPIPVVRHYYASKPLQYLGNVIGHEGEGSLLARLRELGWANSLSAGGGISYSDTAAFTVDIGLTEAGVERVDEISALLFQFLALIREGGIDEWRFAEQRTMADLAFRYQEPSSPLNAVSSLSSRLQEYPPQEVLSAPYDYRSFDPDLLRDLLSFLRPGNVLLTFTSRTAETDSTETWYETPYSVAPITEERVARWRRYPADTSLAPAPPNPFLPETLELHSMDAASDDTAVHSAALKPELLYQQDGIRLWFKHDDEFETPRANFFVYALTPLFREELRNYLLSTLAVSLVNDKLNEYSYPVNLAGSWFGLSARSRGFTMTISGYSDKQTVLLEKLLATLKQAEFSQERFDILRSEMIRGWENAALQTPYIRLFEETQALLIEPYWPEAEKIAAVKEISLEDVQRFIPELLSGLRLDVLYHGNVLPEDAMAMLDILGSGLRPDAAAEVPDYGTILKMPRGTRVVQELRIDHEDSAIVIYLQGPDDSLRTQAAMELLGTLMAAPFYETLRTEQQLGYIVNAGALPLLDTSGLIMYIESPSHDPLALEANIDAFLADWAEELAAMDAATFNEYRSGLLTTLRAPVQRLGSLSSRYWNDIMIGEFAEDSTLKLADAVAALSREEVVEYFKRLVHEDAGRLVARSAGNTLRESYLAALEEGEDAVLLDDGVVDYRPFKDQAEHYEFR